MLQLSTIHRVFPILGHRSKLFQVLRVAIYEGLRARPWLENPLRPSDRGLYTVLLGRRR